MDGRQSDSEPDPTTDAALPLFPLPTVVLFPAVAVPLYIFEPRYRQMTAAALAGAGKIGMVTVEPRFLDDLAGNPPVFDVGCAGEIRRSEPRPDGTYNILLHGLHRFRIRRELPAVGDRLYRCAEVERLADPEPTEEIAGARSEVLDLMRQILPDRASSFRAELFANVADTPFVNAFCQAIELSTLEKQKLLEANGVRERADELVSLLRFLLAEHAVPDIAARKTLH